MAFYRSNVSRSRAYTRLQSTISTCAKFHRNAAKNTVNGHIKQAGWCVPPIGCFNIIQKLIPRATGSFDNLLASEALPLTKTITHERECRYLLPPACLPTSPSRHYSPGVYRSATEKSTGRTNRPDQPAAMAGEGSNGWTHTVVRVSADGTWERMVVGASSLVTFAFPTFHRNHVRKELSRKWRQCINRNHLRLKLRKPTRKK